MSEPVRNRLGAWVDPEPIRLVAPFGLTALLYRRTAPPKVKPKSASRPPSITSPSDPEPSTP